MASQLTSSSLNRVNSFSKFHLKSNNSPFPLMQLHFFAASNYLKNILTFCLFFAALFICPSKQLDNGLARTPPMGWMSWERFACEIDCETYPSNCIGESLFRETADILASQGYRDAGYVYINIDDCWSELARDRQSHKLLPNSDRFPNGIDKLSQYIHSLGLKFGIYSDIGTKTCAGYPGHLATNGSLNYFTLDAETFASWGVDSLKVDGCYVANDSDYKVLYPKLGQALNATGRPILYACSWPAYQIRRNPDWESIAKHCNLWRNFDDIMDSWSSILSIIDFYVEFQDEYAKYHGPGHWFDPDMILVGDFGLSVDQSKAQMAIWSMLSAPLLMSNDLRSIGDEFKEILLNRHVIDVDQDPLGKMGRVVVDLKNGRGESIRQVWVKKLSQPEGSYAVVYFYRAILGDAKYFSYPIHKLLKGYYLNNLNETSESTVEQLSDAYSVHDLFQDGHMISKVQVGDNLILKVNPSGVRMVKLVAIA